jgi:serine phosphatase RsbU (regulator of sigma subunit)
VYAVANTRAETLTVANAGHPPLILRRPDGRVERIPAPAGPPVGLGLPNYDEVTVPFPPGTMLFGCTDGLLETRTSTVSEGLDRFEQYVAQLDDASQSRFDVNAVADDLLAWMSSGEPIDDDIALVVLRHEPEDD